MWPFRKPTDPAAEEIARLNAEAEERARNRPPTPLRDYGIAYLGPREKLTTIISANQIRAGALEAEPEWLPNNPTYMDIPKFRSRP